MAISLTQKREVQDLVGSSSVAATYSGAVAAGALLICVFRFGVNDVVGNITVSDTVNGAWTLAFFQSGGANAKSIGCYFFPNTAAGTPTVTASWTAGASAVKMMHIFEYAGMVTSGALDQSITANPSAGATSPSTGAMPSTANANDLLIGALALGSTDTVAFTEDAAFTQQLLDTFGTSGRPHLNTGHRIVSSTGAYAYNPSLSPGSALDVIIGIAAFKGASANLPFDDSWIPSGPMPFDPNVTVW